MEKARAKRAYDAIQQQIGARDINNDSMFEDLLSERAFQLEKVSLFIFNKIISFIYSSVKLNNLINQIYCLLQMQ